MSTVKQVNINGATEVRKLNPFTYKDLIKTLEKSNEARVTIDGTKVFRSAVTSGKDVKAFSGMKYHLYFYTTEAAAKAGPIARDWIPITAEEFRAYKNDAAYTINITSVKAEQPAAEPETPAAEPAAETPAPTTRKGRKAQRETIEA